MVDPAKLCRKHLLGEHVETHMFLGTLKQGKSIAGFIEKGLLEPKSLKTRHDDLAREMLKRGYAHNSPMDKDTVKTALEGLALETLNKRVDVKKSASDLAARCMECAGKLKS